MLGSPPEELLRRREGSETCQTKEPEHRLVRHYTSRFVRRGAARLRLLTGSEISSDGLLGVQSDSGRL